MATARSATSPTTGADRYRITAWPAAMRRKLRWRRKVRTNNSPSSREIPSRVNRRDRVSPGASASWCTAMPSMLVSGSRANVSVEASAEALKTAAVKRTWMRMPNPGWKATTRAHGASPDGSPNYRLKPQLIMRIRGGCVNGPRCRLMYALVCAPMRKHRFAGAPARRPARKASIRAFARSGCS